MKTKKTNEMTHTPTPWRVNCDDICAANGNRIFRSEDLDDRINQANAAFIVRAVNSHDDLLMALSAIHAETSDRKDTTMKAILDRVQKLASEAIAKAEGK